MTRALKPAVANDRVQLERIEAQLRRNGKASADPLATLVWIAPATLVTACSSRVPRRDRGIRAGARDRRGVCALRTDAWAVAIKKQFPCMG